MENVHRNHPYLSNIYLFFYIQFRMLDKFNKKIIKNK